MDDDPELIASKKEKKIEQAVIISTFFFFFFFPLLMEPGDKNAVDEYPFYEVPRLGRARVFIVMKLSHASAKDRDSDSMLWFNYRGAVDSFLSPAFT